MMMKAATSLLLVDDEPDIRANLSDILTDMGYQVDTAADGPSALKLVSARPYDVALLDLKMPGMDGLELYRQIKQARAGTVAMIITAYASPETSAAAKAAGAWQVLSKPVDIGKLLPLVAEAADQPLVMVVDDDRDLCENLWDLLREGGYRVCLAHDETSARQHLRGRDFHVVLIDWQLPESDGETLYRLLRKENPQAKVILITGHRAELQGRLPKILPDGASAVCYKPFDMAKLLETVRQLSGSSPAG